MRDKDVPVPVRNAVVQAAMLDRLDVASFAPRFVGPFSNSILRPKVTFGYAAPGSPSADTICP